MKRPEPAMFVAAGCKGKPSFSAAKAHEQAQRMRRRKHVAVRAYHCRFCRHWHVGNNP